VKLATLLTAALMACGSTNTPATTPAHEDTMLEIKHTSVYVDDQDKALRFYTQVLGFTKKDDVTQGPYRWLTVKASADGAELQLAKNDDPTVKAYQQSLFAKHQPAAMFYTDNIQRDFERIKAAGGTVVMPPTPVPHSTIAQIDDGCGNLVQITQLQR
jgi:predicted enzyme related to lactoylglutathione lyase